MRYGLMDESGAVPVVFLYDPRPGVDAVEIPEDVFAGSRRDMLGNWVPATTAPAVPEPPASITRRQCAAELFGRDMITSAEAVAMVATATPPAAIEAALTALAEPEQTMARIDFAATEGGLTVEAHVETTDRTGVEMEALHACAVAALTIYDMCKSADRAMVIGEIALWEKSGGRQGHYLRDGS